MAFDELDLSDWTEYLVRMSFRWGLARSRIVSKILICDSCGFGLCSLWIGLAWEVLGPAPAPLASLCRTSPFFPLRAPQTLHRIRRRQGEQVPAL